jgi:hypothetical protein
MGYSVRKVLLCVILVLGSIIGVPMRPREIEELLRSVHQPSVSQTIKKDD